MQRQDWIPAGLKTLALSSVTAFGLTGCLWQLGPDDLNNNNPNGTVAFSQVTTPADFKFATTQRVALTVLATSRTLGASPTGLLKIANEEGGVLFEGPVTKEVPFTTNFAVALDHKHITVTLTTPDGDIAQDLALAADGKVSFTF